MKSPRREGEQVCTAMSLREDVQSGGLGVLHSHLQGKIVNA